MIIRKDWFTYRTAESNPEYVIIVPKDYDTFPFNIRTGGSYALAPARILGLTYPEYLRFLLTMFSEDVKIIGKNSLYPVAYWKRGQTLNAFIRMLNAKFSLAMGLAENENNE